MTESALLAVWRAFGSRMTWQTVIERGGDKAIAERVLNDLPEVSALDALEANRQLIELLARRHWFVMREAREAGASWAEIGTALGMTKQGAQDWYRRRIAEQEQYVGDLHDAERARAVAEDNKTVEV